MEVCRQGNIGRNTVSFDLNFPQISFCFSFVWLGSHLKGLEASAEPLSVEICGSVYNQIPTKFEVCASLWKSVHQPVHQPVEACGSMFKYWDPLF